MQNLELECIPGWRYCNVRAGEKAPYPANWQQRPLALRDIESANVGLLLGPTSHGVCALDFDGTSAWSWFERNIGCELPPTATWTSGKQDRCQMAFRVPSTYWLWIRTLKITHTRTDEIEPGEGFEFRWAGAQSVMPPSTLHDGRCYEWIRSPGQVGVAELPDGVLAYWLTHANPDVPETPTRDLTALTDADVWDIESLLMVLQQKYATLDYDTWRTTAWATAHHIGAPAAGVLMHQYWPERERGEYQRLYKTYNAERSPRIGSIRHILGEEAAGEIALARAQLEIDNVTARIKKWQ
jgi:hypothetical protein